MELAVLKDFHCWSKGTVTLYVSVGAATLSSPKTIVVNNYYYTRIVCSVQCHNNIIVLCATNLWYQTTIVPMSTYLLPSKVSPLLPPATNISPLGRTSQAHIHRLVGK